jgi:hypothetical protein
MGPAQAINKKRKKKRKTPDFIKEIGRFMILAPQPGLEPGTGWLTATCSTD